MPPPARPREPGASPAVRLVVHPPERRRPSDGLPAQSGGCCCCCCCCCLHAVGGVIGGVIGSVKYVEPTHREDQSPFPYRMDEPEPPYTWFATFTFWTAFLGLTGLTWAYFLFSRSVGVAGDVIWSGVLTLLVLPGVQILACVLALLAVAVTPESLLGDKGAAFRRVSHITLLGFVGSLIGLGAMLLMLPFLMFFR